MTPSPTFISAILDEIRTSATQVLETTCEVETAQAMARLADLSDLAVRALDEPATERRVIWAAPGTG